MSGSARLLNMEEEEKKQEGKRKKEVRFAEDVNGRVVCGGQHRDVSKPKVKGQHFTSIKQLSVKSTGT